ncbi:MAG: imelysin family protein [Roseibium sp.]
MHRLFLAVFCACLAAPAGAMDYKAPVERIIGNYIRPAMTDFAIAAKRLPAATTDVCLETDLEAVANFRSAYSGAIEAFAKVHFLRFGPLLDQDRVSRLAFMPDPRGVGMRQIRKVFVGKDASVLSIESLKEKSVALQGLTALQLIAFDKDGSLTLGQASDTKEFVCGYALAISQNVSEIADGLADDWADEAGYSALLLSAGPDNHRFRSEREALETVFNMLSTGLIVARDQNLLPVLGTSETKAKPKRIPFSRSGNGILFLSSELKGLEQALDSMELKAMVPSEHAWLFDTAGFEFKNAQNMLAQLKSPIRQTFYDNNSYSKIAVLAITLQSLRELVTPEIAGALGLTGGFNALDGD